MRSMRIYENNTEQKPDISALETGAVLSSSTDLKQTAARYFKGSCFRTKKFFCSVQTYDSYSRTLTLSSPESYST